MAESLRMFRGWPEKTGLNLGSGLVLGDFQSRNFTRVPWEGAGTNIIFPECAFLNRHL